MNATIKEIISVEKAYSEIDAVVLKDNQQFLVEGGLFKKGDLCILVQEKEDDIVCDIFPITDDFYDKFMTWRGECFFADLEIPELEDGQDVTDLLEEEDEEDEDD